VGILKTQSTLTIAVWSSVLLHTAGFLGFELAFSNREESFPKSEPRTVTVVSISSVPSPVSSVEAEVEKSIQEKVIEQSPSEISLQKEIVLQDRIVGNKASSKLVSKNIDINTPENEILFSKNVINESGDGGSTGTRREAVIITEPVPVKSIEPEYPFRARKKGLEGVVILDVTISKFGEPVSCNISDSSGYKDLDNAAKKTVLSAHYQPGTINGEDIESTLRINISFKLNKS